MNNDYSMTFIYLFSSDFKMNLFFVERKFPQVFSLGSLLFNYSLIAQFPM
jgi:hypothetical protein